MTIVRKVPVPQEEFLERRKEIKKRWRRGKPFHRLKAEEFRSAPIAVTEGKVVDVPWFSHLGRYPDEEVRRKLMTFVDRSLLLNRILSPNAHNVHSLKYAMLWAGMKTWVDSDTANWFSPTDALAHKLLATRLDGIDPEQDLKTPVSAFFSELPPGFLYVRDPATGKHEVRVMLVADGEVGPDDRRSSDAWPMGPHLCVILIGSTNSASQNEDDDSVSFYTTPKAGFGDIEKILETDASELGHAVGWLGERELRGNEFRVVVLRFVYNFLVYLNSSEADIRHEHEHRIKKARKSKRKKDRAKAKRLEAEKRWIVGTKVTIDPDFRKGVREGGGITWKLKYKTLVRGHWRNQAHGKGHKLRRRRWIEPYVRGKDLGDRIVGHDYEVR